MFIYCQRMSQRSWSIIWWQYQSVKSSVLADGLAQNPSVNYNTDSLHIPQCHENSNPHTHTHTQKPSVLSAWDLEMGAEACALVWRPDRVEAHTFGLRGALRTPELRGIKRAGWRSTTVLWTPLTRWRVMVENTDERKTSLVFQWKTIYTGSFSVPSGIKYAAMPHCHCSEETVTWPMLVVEPDGPGVWVRMCLGSLIAPVQVDSRIVRAC